ncbi:hypothetical protein UlMin_021140 [Ulmus minor]
MQRGGEGREGLFNSSDPSSNFGSNRSMFPSLFGGRDPFDDPFFSRPFGSLFESSLFGPRAANSDRLERRPEKGILIEELSSDDEGQEDEGIADDNDNGPKHTESSKEPTVEHPDDAVDERKNKNVSGKSEPYKVEKSQPHSRNFSFQTSKVTYGGVDGAYYTSTRTRRAGSDGVVIEENKEADKTTKQAAHRISRGIQDKGHSVTRKLASDGRVDTSQTLHNLDEEELAGFEEAWNSNASRHFPGWKGGFDMNDNRGFSRSAEKGEATWRHQFLPLLEEGQARGTGADNERRSTGGRTKNVVRINIE